MPTTTERSLLACPDCHRQYDVTGFPPGTRVRCECAAVLTTTPTRPHAPRPMRCGRCGGKLREDASKCDYCDGEITLEERGLSGVCPRCFARLMRDARFCMECGVEIAPQALMAVREDAACPRCKSALRSRSLGTISFVECGSCAGLWLAQADLDALCERADLQDLAARALDETVPTSPVDVSKGPAYIPCPTCKSLMTRRNFGRSSGVLIDVCRGHGVWLDHRELERILDFVRAGGLEKAHRNEVERLKLEADRARSQTLTGWTVGDTDRRLGRDVGLLEAAAWIASAVLRAF